MGNESKFKKAYADITFKQFYKEALKQEIYDQSKYELTYELSVSRNQQLDNLEFQIGNAKAIWKNKSYDNTWLELWWDESKKEIEVEIKTETKPTNKDDTMSDEVEDMISL